MQKLQVTFVSNYINHHQIPFCNAMSRQQGVTFTFVQTEKMAEERVQMGWNAAERPEYVKCYYEETVLCKHLIADSDVVLYGGVDDESYIAERLQSGKMVIRISERLYKTGQWKAVSPRGLKQKYKDHTKYRKAPVYLLCAGGYVASDFHIVHAYPGKMYTWGYFPETEHFDVEEILANKGWAQAEHAQAETAPAGCAQAGNTRASETPADAESGGGTRVPYLLWAARMIDWKHPELAVETAKYLRDRGLNFRLDIIGGGELAPAMEELAEKYGLKDKIIFRGYQNPKEVRRYMKKADIFLFTSDRQEGWGAVANEAMNSACAVVANHMIGAVPYLLRNGENGLVYADGENGQLFEQVEKLVRDRQLCRELGRNAYKTITETWNAENAAKCLMELIGKLQKQEAGNGVRAESSQTKTKFEESAPAPCVFEPCSPTPVWSERRWKKFLNEVR